MKRIASRIAPAPTGSWWTLLQKKFILMLTATPVENNLLELYNLITLLKPGLLATEAEFRKSYVTPGKPNTPKNPAQLRSMLGDVMIRNTRAAADVQLPRRIAASVAIAPSETEAQIYDLVSQFVAGRYQPKAGKRAPRMALDLMQRQAGSSPQALSRAVVRALREESWTQAADRVELEAILDLAAGVEESGKGTQLGKMLAAHPGKAVVFTEFVATLDHLRRVCEERGISLRDLQRRPLARREGCRHRAIPRRSARAALHRRGRRRTQSPVRRYDRQFRPAVESHAHRAARGPGPSHRTEPGCLRVQLLPGRARWKSSFCACCTTRSTCSSWWWARWMPSWERSTTAGTSRKS